MLPASEAPVYTAVRRAAALAAPAAALALGLLACSCAPVLSRALPDVGVQGWHQDLATFERELPRRHKNAFHHVSRDSFERSIARLDARLPTLSNADVFMELNRITAAIGDGHTGLFVPTNFHRYLIGLRPFGDDLRVVQVGEQGRALLGGTLVQVGDVPVSEAKERVSAFVHQDENPWLVRAGVPQWLVVTEALHDAGIAADTTGLSYTVRDSTGRLVSATLPAVALSTPAKLVAARVDTPITARRRIESLWFEPLAGDSCVYVSFVRYPHLARYAHRMWAYVDRHHVATLIIDLRRNGGGNYFTGRRYLVNPARRRVAAGKLRHVYVMIGNSTFSAAMVNAIDFRDRCHAVLIGEPIGERPNSYSERRLTVLPHSRIVVTYSVRYYHFQPSDDPPAVMPDVTIEPTWEEFLAARDPVLEWALAHRSGP